MSGPNSSLKIFYFFSLEEILHQFSSSSSFGISFIWITIQIICGNIQRAIQMQSRYLDVPAVSRVSPCRHRLVFSELSPKTSHRAEVPLACPDPAPLELGGALRAAEQPGTQQSFHSQQPGKLTNSKKRKAA